MRIRILRPGDRPPSSSELLAENIVILDDYGNPLVAVQQVASSAVITTIKDPDFAAVLKRLGIQLTLDVTWLEQGAPPPHYDVLQRGKLLS